MDIDETTNTIEVKRYYYLFMEGELEYLLPFFPNLRLLHRFFDGQNWCVQIEVL